MNTDPIADFLTRIRNAIKARHDVVTIPYSKIKENITKILLEKKFIAGYKKEDSKEMKYKVLNIELIPNKQLILKRCSKPGQRIYLKNGEIHKVKNGYGLKIVSTNKGVISDQEARKLKTGGEILCEVY